jgi:hypothetical protein
MITARCLGGKKLGVFLRYEVPSAKCLGKLFTKDNMMNQKPRMLIWKAIHTGQKVGEW